MLRKKESIEYTLAYYMLLTQILIFAVSILNIFKPYVSDTFLLSMIILMVWIVFSIAVVVIFAKVDLNQDMHPSFGWLGVVLLLMGFTGNLFSFILLYSILLKSTKRDSKIDKWNKFWFSITKNFTAMLGLLFVIFTFAVSITSYGTFVDTFAVENNYTAMLLDPSLMYPFGTDDFGR